MLPGMLLAVIAGLIGPAQKPTDACALLKAADVQALAGTAKVGPGKASTEPGLGSLLCQYIWGSGGNVQGGRSYLNVTVTAMAKAFPGTNLSTLKAGLLAKAKQSNSGVISGVGDAAIYESGDAIRVETSAFVKGKLLTVTFESANARARKDDVIAVLKAAARGL